MGARYGGAVAEARRLWAALSRPNVMIEVPATREGPPLIRTLLAEGVNVDVTLLLSLERYREVADAWLAALEERADVGAALGNVASVASFFLSRIIGARFETESAQKCVESFEALHAAIDEKRRAALARVSRPGAGP